MRRFSVILVTILLSAIATQPLLAVSQTSSNQQYSQTNNCSDKQLQNPSSDCFQMQLDSVKMTNQHLGPNYDLVHPGDVLVLRDGTRHTIQKGEYISKVMLRKYMQDHNLDPGQLVAIVRPGQSTIIIPQSSEPSNVATAIYGGVLSILAIIANLVMIWFLVRLLRDGNSNASPSSSASRRQQGRAVDSGYQHDGPVVLISGDGHNTVSIINHYGSDDLADEDR